MVSNFFSRIFVEKIIMYTIKINDMSLTFQVRLKKKAEIGGLSFLVQLVVVG